MVGQSHPCKARGNGAGEGDLGEPREEGGTLSKGTHAMQLARVWMKVFVPHSPWAISHLLSPQRASLLVILMAFTEKLAQSGGHQVIQLVHT